MEKVQTAAHQQVAERALDLRFHGTCTRFAELLMENDAFNRSTMLKVAFGGITSFIDEGRAILSEEFGKAYGAYFTILSSIAFARSPFLLRLPTGWTS